MTKVFDPAFLDALLASAAESPRLRMNHDLRNSAADTSQRMLNALLPGTVVPVHRHEDTAETVVCLRGRLWEVIYEEVPAPAGASGGVADGVSGGPVFREVSRHLLCPAEGCHGMQVPAGAWHTIEVLEPSVIFEAKDGAYRGGGGCDPDSHAYLEAG